MIEGELYVLAEYPKCVFAYKNESGGSIYHYACVNRHNKVKIPGIGFATGTLFRLQTRIANDEERSRFYEYLHESGYHYNIANRKVINIITGELV
jgi:hypothetical protein